MRKYTKNLQITAELECFYCSHKACFYKFIVILQEKCHFCIKKHFAWLPFYFVLYKELKNNKLVVTFLKLQL